jgi:hypothetical protein
MRDLLALRALRLLMTTDHGRRERGHASETGATCEFTVDLPCGPVDAVSDGINQLTCRNACRSLLPENRGQRLCLSSVY